MTTQSASPTNPPRTPPVDEPKMPPPATEQPDSTTSPGLSPDSNSRRWSSFPGHFIHRLSKPKAPLSPTENKPGGATASAAPADHAKKPSAFSSSDRRAKQSALNVRSLIVGQDADEGGLSPRVPVSHAQLKDIKAQLLKPKSAGKVIAQLRALPALSNSSSSASEPIQAVCLPYTDQEADEKQLSRFRDLKPVSQPQSQPQPSTSTTKTDAPPRSPAVASSTIESVAEAIRNLHVVNLFTAPALGLGQPADGPGLLAGALPTAETVINGLTQITPQLMALSYATGHALTPDHKGVYPPMDRVSVLTCTPSLFDALWRRREMSNVFCVDWWGLELLLPPPTLAYLSVSRRPLSSNRSHSI
jgi:hypothetical protein